MKSYWIVRAKYEIEVDAARPHTLTQAAAWVADLQSGKVSAAPEGLEVTVEVGKPKITNRKDAE